MKAKAIKTIVIILALTLVLGCFTACKSNSTSNIPVIGNLLTEKIDLSQYIVVSFNGYNGAGTAQIDASSIPLKDIFDETDIVNFVKKYSPYSSPNTEINIDNYILNMLSLDDLYDFEFVSENGNLSNGNTVTVKVVIDNDFVDEEITIEDVKSGLGIDFDEEITFTVSGLKDGIAIDILSDIEQYITYTGANGDGVLTLQLPEDYCKEINGFYFTYSSENRIDVIYNNEDLGYVGLLAESGTNYDSNQVGNLSQDQQVKIYLSNYSTLDEYNVYFAPTSKNVTVPELGNYVTSANQLTDEYIKQINEYAIENGHGISVDEYIPTGDMYVGTLKPQYANENNSTFVIFTVIEEYTEAWGFWDEEINYVIFALYDVYIAPDGTLEYGSYDYGFNYESFVTIEDISNYISRLEEYECTKIQ